MTEMRSISPRSAMRCRAPAPSATAIFPTGGPDRAARRPLCRRWMMVASQALAAAAILGLAFAPFDRCDRLLLCLAGAASASLSMNLYAVAQMFAGPRASGTWVGFQNALGNISGIVGPPLTGLIIDRAGYESAFMLTAALPPPAPLVGVRCTEDRARRPRLIKSLRLAGHIGDHAVAHRRFHEVMAASEDHQIFAPVLFVDDRRSLAAGRKRADHTSCRFAGRWRGSGRPWPRQ